MASMADYEEVRSLYKREGMEVVLVRHRTLREERVLKKIRKGKTGEEDRLGETQLMREAGILPKLKSPGIPIIYDYWEDEKTICLIEEYVRGISLQEYVLYHPDISLQQMIWFMIRTCEVICYLHCQTPPILYQDLKPEHLIVKGERLVLIDYGIARSLEEKTTGLDGYGSRSYAAPEQKNGMAVDEKSDLYSLGKLAEELLQHTTEKIPASLDRLVKEALCADPMGRPASVKVFQKSWEELLVKIQEKHKGGNRTKKEIAVIGNEHGVGVTHVAFCLTAHLRRSGQTAYYVNRSGKAVLVPALRQRKELREKDGVIYHRDFAGLMDYGPAMIQTTPPDGIKVIDCGCDWLQAKEAELIFYVIGSRPWHDQEIMMEKARLDGCIPVITPANQGVGHKMAKETGKKVFGMPLEYDPMSPGQETNRLLRGILKNAGID